MAMIVSYRSQRYFPSQLTNFRKTNERRMINALKIHSSLVSITHVEWLKWNDLLFHEENPFPSLARVLIIYHFAIDVSENEWTANEYVRNE